MVMKRNFVNIKARVLTVATYCALNGETQNNVLSLKWIFLNHVSSMMYNK